MKPSSIFYTSIFYLSFFSGCQDGSNVAHSPELIAGKDASQSSNIADLLTGHSGAVDLNELLTLEIENESNKNADQLAIFYGIEAPESNRTLPNEEALSMVEDDFTNAPPIVSDKNLALAKANLGKLNDLENSTVAKDATIATLKELNAALLEENDRLREFNLSQVDDNSDLIDRSEQPQNITQIGDLKGQLEIQKIQIEELQSDNKILEGKVLELTKNPYSKIKLSTPVPLGGFNVTKEVKPLPANTELAELQFDAVVTSINGKNKEAFYTEFFILEDDLETLLLKSDLDLSDFPKLDSYSELWARSRKNPFLYPGVQKKIRTLLLNQVNDGKGKRIRTDIDGAGVVLDLSTGNYSVIGSAALGKIGVTWNAPIKITSGLNKLSLTLANSSWSL